MRWIARIVGPTASLIAVSLIMPGCGSTTTPANTTETGARLINGNAVAASDNSSAVTANDNSAGQGNPVGIAGNGLNLTAAQQGQATTISAALETDIAAAATAAKSQIQGILTDEQETALAGKLPPLGTPFGGPGGAMPGPGFPPGGATPGPGFAGGEPLGAGSPGQAPTLNGLPDELQLTDEQKTQIGTINTEAQQSIQARLEQARSAFSALLTEEQTATLDELEARQSTFAFLGAFGFHMFGGGPGPMGGGPIGSGDPLKLTTDQQTQAGTIFDSLKADMDTLEASIREQIQAVLTAEQVALMDQHPGPADFGGGPPHAGPAGFGGGPAHAGPAEFGGGPPQFAGRFGGPGAGGPGAPVPAGPWQSHRDATASGAPKVPQGTVDDLKLSSEKVAQIETILSDLSTSTTTREQQAQTQFRAILTDAQIAQLDQFPAPLNQPE
jgi:Spy/CpxP family protein refolding chaperone